MSCRQDRHNTSILFAKRIAPHSPTTPASGLHLFLFSTPTGFTDDGANGPKHPPASGTGRAVNRSAMKTSEIASLLPRSIHLATSQSPYGFTTILLGAQATRGNEQIRTPLFSTEQLRSLAFIESSPFHACGKAVKNRVHGLESRCFESGHFMSCPSWFTAVGVFREVNQPQRGRPLSCITHHLDFRIDGLTQHRQDLPCLYQDESS